MTAGSPEVYARNLAALGSRSPALAALVDAAEPFPLTASSARNGLATARAGGLWLHSRYDPASEARRVVDEATAGGADLVVCLGLGLGYAAEAALADGVRVIASELDPGWLRSLLAARDMSGLLADDRLSLVVCPGGEGLSAYLDEATPRSIASVDNAATLAAFPEASSSLRATVDRYRRKDEINAATLKRFGRLWVRNLARNRGRIAALPGISTLEGLCSGLPALVLAAGPSLDDVLPELPALRERLVVVCVDTALRSALRAGIQPDFVVVADPQYWNARHVDRCDASGSVLVTEAAVWPSVLRLESRLAVLASSMFPLGRYLEERVGPPKGRLGAGGSVATSAWDFARLLGCADIYMAGLDLSFPDGKTHARASLFEQRSLAEGTRLSPASLAGFEAMRGGAPYPAAANDGSTVVSDRRLSLYSWWFASRAARFPGVTTRNLSERGLAVPNLEYAPLGSLRELPPVRADLDRRLRDAVARAAAEGPAPGADERLAAAMEGLALDIEGLAGLAERAAGLADSAKGASGATLSAALEELASIDGRVLSSEAKDVVGFIFPSLPEALGGKPTTLDASLAQTSRVYRAIAESARWHLEVLRGA